MNDTIAAISTTLGVGAISIIRVSGKDAIKEVNKITNIDLTKKESHTISYGYIKNNNEIIDEVLITIMKAPKTFTKENIVEINCHGGIATTKKTLELLLEQNIRLAEPGEFTKRAFLNGRIDLSQAEAIIDVIKSKTDMAHEVAQNQLEGSLAKKIKDLRMNVTEVLAHLEVSIDFAEEDVEEITYQTLEEKAIELRNEIKKLYDTAESGKILRDGLKTVIVGKPNVGKSSLLNSILGENRAIVTDIAGTTRDVIEEFVNIKGIPLKIVDTAGIRETEDIVEKIGVEKSRESFSTADLVIMVLDASRKLSEEDMEILENLKNKKTIVLLNKMDLEPKIELEKVKEFVNSEDIIEISALKHQGIEQLQDKIESMVYHGSVKNSSNLMITNSRHKDALFKAYESINDAINAIDQRMPYDFIEVDFKNIWDYLGYINGDTVREDLLDTIFANFCIGK